MNLLVFISSHVILFQTKVKLVFVASLPLKSKRQHWLARNENKVSEWSDMSTHGLLLAHLAKGNLSFCHHLASVVCRRLTFHIFIFSSETP